MTNDEAGLGRSFGGGGGDMRVHEKGRTGR